MISISVKLGQLRLGSVGNMLVIIKSTQVTIYASRMMQGFIEGGQFNDDIQLGPLFPSVVNSDPRPFLSDPKCQ